MPAWFDPRGRLSRPAFGRFVVRSLLLSAVLLCLAIAAGSQGFREAAFASAAVVVGLTVAGLVQAVRRLHDRGRTGWWLLPALVLVTMSFPPVETQADAHPLAVTALTATICAGTLWFLIETLGRRGIPGPNRFGPEPDDL